MQYDSYPGGTETVEQDNGFDDKCKDKNDKTNAYGESFENFKIQEYWD